MAKYIALAAIALFFLAMMFPQYVPKPQAQVEEVAKLSSSISEEIPSFIVEKFKAYKAQYNKVYESVEVELYRMAIYYSNFIVIQMTNAEQREYELGENQFMDLAQEEWAAQFLIEFPEGYDYPEDTSNEVYAPPNAAFNWVDQKGKVGPVLNQGSCGSCWAFSATETVQSYFGVNKGELPSLSEQQLVDCSTSYGNQGCNGGWPSWALNYVKASGITTSSAYPYTGRDGSCRATGGAYKINQVKTSAGCSTLTADINTQPTSVCVDASNWSLYRSGVFSNCGTNINHAVLATGWDASGNWIIQNSWGTSWGQAGFITLKSGNTCAVCNVLANAY
jgi:C1A family cysteine protease